MHHKRRLLIALVVTGALTAGFGVLAGSASAQARTFHVVLLGGKPITLTLDLPPNLPLSQVQIPGLGNSPLLSITEVTPTTTAPVAPTTTPTAPSAGTPSEGGSSADKSSGSKSKSRGKGAERRVGLLNEPAPNRDTPVKRPLRGFGGVPTLSNPTTSLAFPGPAAVGVPNFFINRFSIPPFLLSIYQAAGIQYGVRWEVLAAINEIETDYGRNLNVSSAGAMGWMQFIPSSWKQYGVDANQDGKKDPYNPVDAIFDAARYLKAAGADKDLRKAIFAYNHADWYVDSVLLRARMVGGLPADLVGSLSGLTQGQFPVHAVARYADDLSERDAKRRVARGKNAAIPVEGSKLRRGINIFAKAGSPVVAVQDGTITKLGRTARLGNFVQMRDVYGNTYTYAHLKKVAKQVPVPKDATQTKASIAKELELPKNDPKPKVAASAGKNAKSAKKAEATDAQAVTDQVAKERLFANPTRPGAMANGGKRQIMDSTATLPGTQSLKSYFTGVYGLDKKDVVLKTLSAGQKVIGGTILGVIGTSAATPAAAQTLAPHVLFEIRPAGRGAPRIDPKPILDGWKLLESTAIYRAAGKNPFLDQKSISVGQMMLMTKEQLGRSVLSDPRIDIYQCGREDIQAGLIDRRVLIVMKYLAGSGLRPTISSLKCGHSKLVAGGGRVSDHWYGRAVDVAAVNGIPILGNQQDGGIADITIRRLLQLKGFLKPSQIISLRTYQGFDNTLALSDHDDHIHIGFGPPGGQNATPGESAVLKPGQWTKLIDRLGKIENPTVPIKPSKFSVPNDPTGKAKRGD